MLDALINDFIANGGSITKCPTVYLLPTINAAPLNTGMADRQEEDRNRWKGSREARKKGAIAAAKARLQTPQGERQCAKNKAIAQERYALFRRSYDAGITLKELSVMNGVSVDRVKKILRATGLSFKKAPQGRKPRVRNPKAPPKPLVQFAADEIVRLYTEEKMTINQIAELKKCSNITVRRACSLAGVTRIQGKKPYSPIQAAELEARKQQARQLRSEGKSLAEIGRIMGRCPETIRIYCDDVVAEQRAAKVRRKKK
ncbi:helix-turn-helix domain-containing protein [Paramagnetospirillum kuznetsovii]|nr:helix-turn-helix domain-containing protein [Paramagnetospirillum kuznetsovii]